MTTEVKHQRVTRLQVAHQPLDGLEDGCTVRHEVGLQHVISQDDHLTLREAKPARKVTAATQLECRTISSDCGRCTVEYGRKCMAPAPVQHTWQNDLFRHTVWASIMPMGQKGATYEEHISHLPWSNRYTACKLLVNSWAKENYTSA